ncbi:MAG: HRDC domain-containing protein [Candidatus Rokubacteria bacterium]|nr:HRDC domain-containing protein [Candidatus Rokubacteria bacterium]
MLRELYELRERLARDADRPPFKILSEEILVRLARLLPADRTGLAGVPGCTPRVIERWGEPILAAIARALALPPEAPPVPEQRPRPSVPAEVRRRVEALRRWRSGASPRTGLEPGVLLPNRLIGAIAAAGPRDRAHLGRVDGVRRWRVDALGDEILAAIASA